MIIFLKDTTLYCVLLDRVRNLDLITMKKETIGGFKGEKWCDLIYIFR